MNGSLRETEKKVIVSVTGIEASMRSTHERKTFLILFLTILFF